MRFGLDRFHCTSLHCRSLVFIAKLLLHVNLMNCRSEHWDFKEEMERLRQLRGKGRMVREAKKKNRRDE